MTYEFGRQLAEGARGEAFLDRLFARLWEVDITEPADAQRRGYDRLFTPRHGDPAFTVEYKTDRTAARTNNAFVETVSVDTTGKAGWAYTSQAELLAYFIPAPQDLVYVIPMADLRMQLERFEREYPERSVPNPGYMTKGRLVPLHEFEALATDVIDTTEGWDA